MCAWGFCYHLQWIVLFYHNIHFPPCNQGIYDSCYTLPYPILTPLCGWKWTAFPFANREIFVNNFETNVSPYSGDDALDFTSHSALICKHISVVLFYFDNVIMMVQETCFKSTCHQFDPARNVAIHSCQERLWWSDNHSSYACSDYVAYPHHK